jgi:Zn-dependent M28 family amino/carboxypeptidase
MNTASAKPPNRFRSNMNLRRVTDHSNVRRRGSRELRTEVLLSFAAILLAGSSCPATNDAGRPHRVTPNLSERLQHAVTIDGIREHLEALQVIANRNNETRASGTPGYDASARYVAEQLRASGYEVRFQEFVFPAFVQNSSPVLEFVGGGNLRVQDQFVTMLFSGSGEVTAPVDAIDLEPGAAIATSGCEETDFDGFSGGVALMMRSGCFFREQAANAESAGAVAALVMPSKQDAPQGALRGTLTPDVTSDIPVLGVSYSLGRRLIAAASSGKLVRLAVEATTDNRTTSNVIAETRSGNDSAVVMVGGHLDSVPAGPGINDNGSGSATVLEIAQEIARYDTAHRIRFAFWGAEEFGLLGSIHYVQGLDEDEINALDSYLNFDMLGSSNFVRFVYDGRRAGVPDPEGSIEIQHMFEEHFKELDLATKLIPLKDRSDHALFAAAGIDVGGLFSGADEVKTKGEARAFGGRAGRLNDPCYHLECDTIDHVNFAILDEMADAAADAVATLGGGP